MTETKATVALVSPPDERLIKYSGKYASAMDPPLGLAYLASYLRSKGHKVHLLDSNAMGLTIGQVEAWIKERKPDILGISVFTLMASVAAGIATNIRKSLPGVKVIVGGPHIHFLSEDFLSKCPAVDYAVRGEGEETLNELIEAITQNMEPRNVRGICYRDPTTGTIVSTPDRPYIHDLDTLPFPAYDLLPMATYKAPQVLKGLQPFSIIMTSRGCPFKCQYCNSAVLWGRHQRRRSPANVIEEIKELHEKYGVRALRFEDDLFTLDKEWAGEICEAMCRLGLNKIKWEANGRIGTLNAPLLRTMKKAGCVSIAFGIEFGNQKVLDFADKGLKLEHVKPAIEEIKKAGLRSKAFFMIGYPTETRETVEDTIKFAKTCGVNYAVFSLVTPFPGTALFKYCEENGLLMHKNWDLYQFGTTTNRPIRIPAIPDEELIKLYEKAVREFHYSPRRLLDYTVHHPSFIMKMGLQKITSLFSSHT